MRRRIFSKRSPSAPSGVRLPTSSLSRQAATQIPLRSSLVINASKEENTLVKLSILGDAIALREDCAGLRAVLAEQFATLTAGEEEELITLDQLQEGERGVIVHVSAMLRGRKKFADLGLVPGSELSMEGGAPLFGELLRIRVMGSTLSLRNSDAAYILVRRQ